MGVISNPNTYSPNTTISSSQVNASFSTIYNEFNGSISAANLATGAVTTAKIADSNVTTAKIADSNVTTAKIADTAITPAKLQAGTGTDWAWDSWTPTLSGRFDDGDWTKTCKYIQIGKAVFYTINLIATAAAPMGGGSANAIFTLPVTAATIPGSDGRQAIGDGFLTDDSAQGTRAQVQYGSTTTGVIYGSNVTGSLIGLTAITSTAPFTWTTNDEISITGWYEAA